MSSEAVRTLRLHVVYDSKEADSAAAQSNAKLQAGIKAAAAEQAKADAAYVRAMRGHLAAEKELERQKLASIKAASRAQAQAAREEAARFKQLAREQARATADAEKAKIRAARDAAKEQASLDRDLNAALRASEKETAREREQLNRGLNALLKQSAREEERLAKDAARAKIRSDKEAFAQWKMGADQQHRLAMKHFADQQAATRESDREVAGLLKTYMGFQAVRGLAAGIGAEWRRIADDIGKSSQEWQKFRESLQGVASLEGKMNTNKFAEAEVARAERAHVRPEEMKDFRDAFLAKASLYVGDGPDAKLSAADADRVQEAAAEYAKHKGVSQEEMGGFVGGLLAQQKGRTDAAAMKAQMGKVFATLEASSAPVKHLLPMMARVQSQGVSAERAAQRLAGAPEYAPEEEATHVLRAYDAVRNLGLKGKGEKFGIRKGNDIDTQLRDLVRNLQARQARGEDMDRVLKEVAPLHIAQQSLRGLLNQGGEAGFARWQGVSDRIPADQLDRTIGEGRQSEAGRQYAVDSRLAVEKARMGLRNDAVERRRQIAETELTANKDFERLNLAQMPLSLLPGADDMKTRMVNLQMLRRARAELGESSGIGDAAASMSSLKTLEKMQELLQRIEEHTKKQADAIDAFIRKNPAAVATAGIAVLPAVMPSPRGR